MVSIHASVKDATALRKNSCALASFNPRICKRCDYWFCLHSCSKGCFNPRICKRCDFFPQKQILCLLIVSIHASVKDATFESNGEALKGVFQSTHL